ncbi:MAG: STAS domain-containing protein [Bacteroidetes bacterium]|nr:STAS domain-containing protein [Bacteroidota bacterium]MBU1114916.1 STAS domain-containing protein [Bacteroidota bacterium]MBU1798391.1 STAS domain-containing protein [Bacteroidota bacterium]
MRLDFNLTSNIENNVLVIKTEGYINNDGGEKISKEFEEHFTKGINKVLIDIKSSKVINSIGISYLIEIIEKLNEKNGSLYFCNMDSTIEKTFNIMGLFQFAKKVDSVNEIE